MIGVVAGQEVGGCNPAATLVGTFTPPFYANAATRESSVLTTTPNGSGAGVITLDVTAPLAGKMSFEVVGTFDVMSGGLYSDSVEFFYDIYTPSPYALISNLNIRAFENGTFQMLVSDSAASAIYDTGVVGVYPGVVTAVLDADIGEVIVKIGGTIVTLSSPITIVPGGVITISCGAQYFGLPSGKAFSSKIVTSASAMLYGEGVTICGDAI